MSPEEKKAARAARRRARKGVELPPVTEAMKALYRKGYGSQKTHKPNFSKCCEEVRDRSTNWPHYYQCSRPRGHGPEGAYCSMHDPAVVADRQKASSDRYYQKWDGEKRIRLLGAHGKSLADALILIEKGYNDPRALAAEVLKPIREHLHLWVEQGDPKESTKR